MTLALKKAFLDLAYLIILLRKQFQFSPTTKEEFMNIILSLKMAHAKGTDCFTTNIVKSVWNYIGTPLSCIFNLRFSSGIFPEYLKEYLVVAIHRSEPKIQVQNYRPISLLSTISKIIKNIFKNRLTSYINIKS